MSTSDPRPRAAPMLLFVCSGNICRSPMAEAIAAHTARESGFDIRVASSGTMGLVDMPAEDTACQVIEELGLTLRRHRARQTTREHVREAALVVAATGSHRSWLRVHEPDAQHIVSFDELTGLGDVPDPYGRSLEEYRAVRDMLVAGMPRVLAELKARHAAGANDDQVRMNDSNAHVYRIAVGADHAGFLYKQKLAELLREWGHEVVDFGTYSTDPVDYPLIAFKVGEAVGSGEFERGVLVCGSSIGIAMAANKVRGARAAPVAEPYSAQLSREHNHANIICFAERLVGWEMIVECLRVWLQTEGEGGRHARRVAEIDEYDPDSKEHI